VRTILVSAGVAMVLALFGTPFAIKIFTRRGYGQEIREDGPTAHLTKRGTPTMGGAVIVVASLIGYLAGHELTKDPMTMSGLLVLALMTGLGAVGFVDDFIKIYKQRSLGLRSGAKLAGQGVVGALFAVEVLHHPDAFDITPADAHISFLRDVGPRSGCCRSCCGSSS
jgi:phospho-N-acetylmuramoyl-pentapeptide-transferase